MNDDPVTKDERRELDAEDRRVMLFWTGVGLALLIAAIALFVMTLTASAYDLGA